MARVQLLTLQIPYAGTNGENIGVFRIQEPFSSGRPTDDFLLWLHGIVSRQCLRLRRFRLGARLHFYEGRSRPITSASTRHVL
jgi:hypothetical protein